MSSKQKGRNLLFWGWLGLIFALYIFVIIMGLAMGRLISVMVGNL